MDQILYIIGINTADKVQPTTAEIREALYKLVEEKVKQTNRQYPYTVYVARETPL